MTDNIDIYRRKLGSEPVRAAITEKLKNIRNRQFCMPYIHAAHNRNLNMTAEQVLNVYIPLIENRDAFADRLHIKNRAETNAYWNAVWRQGGVQLCQYPDNGTDFWDHVECWSTDEGRIVLITSPYNPNGIGPLELAMGFTECTTALYYPTAHTFVTVFESRPAALAAFKKYGAAFAKIKHDEMEALRARVPV